MRLFWIYGSRTHTPNNKDLDFLAKKMDEESLYKGIAIPFAYFIRDKTQNIIAGCNGEIMFEVIHTNQLWVDPSYRKQGLGITLMEQVHQHGRKTGCHMATALTMSFQGVREFYEKLGYICDLERPGYAEISSCLFLKKLL